MPVVIILVLLLGAAIGYGMKKNVEVRQLRARLRDANLLLGKQVDDYLDL